MDCINCNHSMHTGCLMCDDNITQTPNGVDTGHAVHGVTYEQLQCQVQGCSCDMPTLY